MDTKIDITNTIQHNLGYSIIPFLSTNLDNQTLFNLLKKYIQIDVKYKSILDHIEENIKHKNINVASLTIEDLENHSTTNTKPKTHKQTVTSKSKLISKSISKSLRNKEIINTKPFSKIHQIFLVVINNKSFNKNDDSELLEGLRITGNTIFNIAKSNYISAFNLVNTLDTKHTLQLESILEGILLSSYRFDKYKTAQALNKQNLKFHLNHIKLITPLNKTSNSEFSFERITKLSNIVRSVFLARDLINEPANTSKADKFIDIIKQFIKQNKLDIHMEILEQDKLEKLGMGLVIGVGRGSSPENAPKV